MHRRSTSSRSTRLVFALALLALGVILPFASAFSAPAAARGMARLLPTAHVLARAVRPVVASNQRPALSDPLEASGQPPSENAAVPAPLGPQDQPPKLPTSTSIEAQAAVPPIVPTPTITPVPLGQVGADSGAPPVATLFPTIGALPAGALAAPPPILMYHYIRVVDPSA